MTELQRLESLLKRLDDVGKRISKGESRLRIAELALNARSHEMQEQERGLVERFYQVLFEDYRAVSEFLDLYNFMEEKGEINPMPSEKREYYESYIEGLRNTLVKLEGYNPEDSSDSPED